MRSVNFNQAINRSFKKFVHSQSGNVTLMFGLAAVPVFLAAGVGLDYLRASNTRLALQHMSDAAALAAAAPTSATAEERKTIAGEYITKNSIILNGITIDGKTVTIGPNTVDVALTATVEGTLTGILDTSAGGDKYGEQGGESESDKQVAAHSKVGFGKDSYLCLLSLNPVDYESVRFYGNSEFMAEVCTVHANSTSMTAMRTQGSAYAQAEDFCAVGGWVGSGFEPDPSGGCTPKKDPYENLALPYVGSCDHTDEVVKKDETASLSPGVYCGGLTIEVHSTANLAPGTYIIKDGKLFIRSHSTVSANNVTFYLVGSSSLEIESGAKVDLVAPATGALKSMAIVQNKNSNPGITNIITSGGDVNITGAYYSPSQQLRVWANGDMNTNSPYFPMVVDKFEMSGNATLHVQLDWEAAGYDEPVELKSPHYVLITQ
jgi:hypothetical protein